MLPINGSDMLAVPFSNGTSTSVDSMLGLRSGLAERANVYM